MGRQIGIDLGTTNSVACFCDGEPRVLLNTFQEELTPSVVAFHRFDETEEGEHAVGRSAVSQAKLFPKDTIFSIKRLMGRPFKKPEVQSWKSRVSYSIVEGEDSGGRAAVMMGGKPYSPEEISALILKYVKSYAERVLGEEVTHAVITVPAYFGDPERAATHEAGRRAGLVVKMLLPEPTAAAIAFGTEAKADGRFVLVYDLGGGTFDISVLSIVQGKNGVPNYNVITVGGDHFLGGDDFDEVIIKMILAHVQEKHGVDLSSDPQFLTVAKQEAEKAKKILSAEDTAPIIVPEATQRDGKSIRINMRVTRADFEKGIAPLVERASKLVVETLKSQSFSADVIDDVLMVGGSTSVPLVGKSMEELFGKEKIRRHVNPMFCVSVGAGILASKMKGVECPGCHQTRDESESQCGSCGASLSVARAKLEQMEIQEIAVNHFGVQGVKGTDASAFFVVVEKGTPLPMKEPRFHVLYTTEAESMKVRVPVFEGVGATIYQNALIGVVEHDLPQGVPINHPVKVGLQVDRQGMVKVVVEVEDYNVLHEVELKRESAADLMADAPLIADEQDTDETERAGAILLHYVERAERFLTKYDTILQAQDKRKLEAVIAEARQALDENRTAGFQEVNMRLDRTLNQCGAASLIEHARVVASGAPQETAAKLNELADQMFKHAEQNDTAVLAKLRDPVANLIRQEHGRMQQIDHVETAKTYDGLLGDKRSSG
jgi:molecular chaperone DnaK